MKKLLTSIFTIMIVAAFATNSYSQDNVDVGVSATVQATFTVTKNTDVAFGNIGGDTSPVLDPNGSNTQVGGGATIGKITIANATASADLAIDWTTNGPGANTATLGDGGSNTMTFTLDVDTHTSDAPGSATDYDTENAAVTASGGGDLFIYIGGNLGTLSSQPAGNYTLTASNGTGQINFAVSYF